MLYGSLGCLLSNFRNKIYLLTFSLNFKARKMVVAALSLLKNYLVSTIMTFCWRILSLIACCLFNREVISSAYLWIFRGFFTLTQKQLIVTIEYFSVNLLKMKIRIYFYFYAQFLKDRPLYFCFTIS